MNMASHFMEGKKKRYNEYIISRWSNNIYCFRL